MILTPEQTKQLLSEEQIYDCCLLTQQFAYKFLQNNVSPIGNLIAFTAPARVGPIGIEQALILAGELQNVNAFGLACFQRLYTVQLGTILTNYTNQDYFMDENSLFREVKQINLTLTNTVKTSGLFHLIFPVVMHTSYSNVETIELDEKANEFVNEAINCFNYLANNIFISTCRDNF
jgi:hypothetical protein